MGDTLMASAVLKPLKAKFPYAEIDFHTGFPEIFGENYPYANLIKDVENEADYDIVYDLGSVNQDSTLPYRDWASFIHLCCHFCGVPFNDPEIFGEPIETEYRVGIVPMAGRDSDIWPPEKFQELINRLNMTGIKCISFGALSAPRFHACHNEYPDYDTSIDKPDRNDWAYGATKMCQHVNRTARIMKGLDVVVAGDTGLFHVAASLLKPTVLLLTSGSPETDFWMGHRSGKIVRSKTGQVADIDVDRVYNAVCKTMFEVGKLNYL